MSETESTNSGDDQVTEEVTETLDDVISQYNVQAPQAPAPSSQPVYRQSAPAPRLDPLDENSVNQFASYVYDNNSALSSQIQEMNQKLTQYEQKEAELRIETDINKAVESINSGLNLNPKLVRTHLELTAQEKPAFKQVWENRHNDPKTYARALKAVQKEIADTYQVRQDPELTETQAAIKQSQRSMASTPKNQNKSSVEEALANATGADFDRAWQEMLGR
jgi:hypothetical protein